MLTLTKIASVFALTLSLAACGNYTTAAVCNDANATQVPGLTGQYTVSVQDEEFNVKTEEFEMKEGSARVKMLSGTKEEEGRLCHVRGWTIVEAFDAEAKAYSQMRLNVSNIGFSVTGIQFNRKTLDDAGIGYELVSIERGNAFARNSMLRKMMPRALLETESAIVVDNSKLSAEDLFKHASVPPFAAMAIRK